MGLGPHGGKSRRKDRTGATPPQHDDAAIPPHGLGATEMTLDFVTNDNAEAPHVAVICRASDGEQMGNPIAVFPINDSDAKEAEEFAIAFMKAVQP